MAHAAAPTPFYSLLGKAQWSTDYINRLPDDAFLVIEPGGKKDDTGRIAPRSLRHLPVLDLDGNLDVAHLQNAIAQIPKAGPWLAPDARKKLQDKARGMLDRALATTHKSAVGVPSWAIGYLRFLDLHESLGVARDFAHKVWGGDLLMSKRLSTWVKAYKAKSPPAATAKPPPAVMPVLRAKVATHNQAHEAPAAKAKLSTVTEVWKRAATAYAAAGRPAMLSKAQWTTERVNAYLYLLGHNGPRLQGYSGDNDLLPVEHPRSPAYKGVGAAATEKDELAVGDLETSGKLVPEVGLPKRSFQGIPIVIDRPKGFVQQGNGWTRTYMTDYGYIPSTLGGDGEELDVYLGPNENATTAFWIVQVREADGQFDEYKLMLGFDSEDAARACYLDHIPERFLGSISSTTVEMVRAMIGLEPKEVLRAMQGPRTYFATNTRGELVMGYCMPMIFDDAPSAPITLSAADYEGMAKAVRAVSALLPEGKAIIASTMGKGWRDDVAKAVEGDVVLLSPMEPFEVDLTELQRFAAELQLPFLLEYPDTPAARAALGDLPGAFVLESAPDRLFVANYTLPNMPGMTMLKAAPPAPPVADAAVTEKAANDTFSIVGRAVVGKAVEERYVLGPVLIPNRADLQGDIYSTLEVRDTAHGWMTDSQNMGVQHAVPPDEITGFRMSITGLVNGKVVPLETWLLRHDEMFDSPAGPRFFPAGTWMLAARFVDDELWAKVKAGLITGWSIGGFAKRTPLTAPVAAPLAA